jgi:hypothetical protein
VVVSDGRHNQQLSVYQLDTVVLVQNAGLQHFHAFVHGEAAFAGQHGSLLVFRPPAWLGTRPR